MKKLLLLLSFILSVTVSYSQDTLKTKMAALYTVVVQPTPGGPGGAKGLIVSGFLNDPAGVYTVASVIVGHIVWDASGRRFKILEINSAVGSTISVDVEALTDGTVEFDTGVGCIQSETGSLPVAVLLGLSELTKQAIAIHTSVVDKYDELQYPYVVGSKLYLTQSIVPVDLDSLGLAGNCISNFTKPTHGFSTGNAIYWNGSEYKSMLNLYGDSQEPQFVVIDSTGLNTFKAAACGIVDTDFGLASGLYYWTDSGWNVSPDTVEYAKLMVLDTTSIVMSLPGLVFDPIGKYLFDLTTSTGQRDFIGGGNIPLLADSIGIVDTIGGIAVTNMQKAVDALEILSTNLDSIPKTTTTTGLVTNTQVLHGNSTGKIIGSTNFTYAGDKLTLIMDAIGASFTQTKSLHLRNNTAATVSVNQVPPLIVYQADGWKTGAPAGTSTIFGEIAFSPFTGTAQASANFFVRGTLGSTGVIGNLINIQPGESIGTTKLMVGAYNTFSAASGILLGTSSTMSAAGIAIGSEVTASGGILGLGNYITASHSGSGVLGNNIVSGGADTWIFGKGGGLTERGFTASGTALIHFTGGTAQLRIQGLPTITTNAWTAAGAVITITTPNANIAVGQGIALMGTISANISYRTIIAVSSTTVFTVSSAPGVASGTSLRTQELNILEVGNGGDSYNQHMIVDKSGLVGLGITPTARLTLAAGTTLVAPVQLTSGTNLTTPINGAVEFDGTNYFVTSSSTRHILSKTLTGTGILDYGSIASLATETLTITVNGAVIGDVVMVGLDNGSKSTGLIFGQPWVSGTNTVSLEAYNSTGSAIDPASGTFRASVIKY